MESEREKSEDEIQFEILDLLKVGLVDSAKVFHVPNGGHRHISVAKKMAALGVLPGVPDLCILVPDAPERVFFLEVKKPNGQLSHDQKNFRDWCFSNGMMWGVARSRNEAESIIRDWRIVRHEYAPLPVGRMARRDTASSPEG